MKFRIYEIEKMPELKLKRLRLCHVEKVEGKLGKYLDDDAGWELELIVGLNELQTAQVSDIIDITFNPILRFDIESGRWKEIRRR